MEEAHVFEQNLHYDHLGLTVGFVAAEPVVRTCCVDCDGLKAWMRYLSLDFVLDDEIEVKVLRLDLRKVPSNVNCYLTQILIRNNHSLE